jgi:hypothetical protein
MRKFQRKQRVHGGRSWQRLAIKHAIRRLGERHQAHLSADEYWELVRQIASGAAPLLYAQTRTRAWHVVQVEGRGVIAVYDRVHRRINTFLEPSALRTIGAATWEAHMDLWGQLIDTLEAAKRAHQLDSLTGRVHLRVDKDWDVLVNLDERPARVQGVMVPAKSASVLFHSLAVGLLSAGRWEFVQAKCATPEGFSSALRAKTLNFQQAA